MCLICSEATLALLKNLCPRKAVSECSWSCWVSVQHLVKSENDCNRPVCVEVFWILQILALLILQYLQCKYCAIKRNLLRNFSFPCLR